MHSYHTVDKKRTYITPIFFFLNNVFIAKMLGVSKINSKNLINLDWKLYALNLIACLRSLIICDEIESLTNHINM